MPTRDEINAQLKEEYPLFFMEMNEMQQKFIRVKNRNGQTPKRRLAESGNKAGKTEIGIAEDLAHSFGKRIWLKKTDPDYKVPIKVPNQGLIGCETLAQSVMQKIWPTIRKLLPKTCKIHTKKNPQGQVSHITIESGPEGEPCGSEIFIRSYDQDADTFEGIDYNWIHWDEPPPKAILQGAERGKAVTNAPSWFTMTR